MKVTAALAAAALVAVAVTIAAPVGLNNKRSINSELVPRASALPQGAMLTARGTGAMSNLSGVSKSIKELANKVIDHVMNDDMFHLDTKNYESKLSKADAIRHREYYRFLISNMNLDSLTEKDLWQLESMPPTFLKELLPENKRKQTLAAMAKWQQAIRARSEEVDRLLSAAHSSAEGQSKAELRSKKRYGGRPFQPEVGQSSSSAPQVESVARVPDADPQPVLSKLPSTRKFSWSSLSRFAKGKEPDTQEKLSTQPLASNLPIHYLEPVRNVGKLPYAKKIDWATLQAKHSKGRKALTPLEQHKFDIYKGKRPLRSSDHRTKEAIKESFATSFAQPLKAKVDRGTLTID